VQALSTGDSEPLATFAAQWLTRERMVAVAQGFEPVSELDSTPIDGVVVLEPAPGGAWGTPEVRLDRWRVTSDQGLDLWVIPRPHGTPYAATSALFSVDGAAGPPGAWRADRYLADHDMPHGLALLRDTSTLYSDLSGPGWHLDAALGPSGNLDAQMYALRNLFGPVTYVGRARDLHRAHAPAREALAEDPWAMARAWRARHLFPGHPYGQAWWQEELEARRLTRAQLRGWRRAVVRPDRGTVVVSGRVEPDEVLALAQRYLGSWRVPPSRVLPSPPPGVALPRRIYGLQWAYPLVPVWVECRVPGRTVQTDAALDVLAFLLSEGIRQTLKDRAGVYGVFARIEPMDRSAAVVQLQAEVGQSSGRAAIEALLALLAHVGQGPGEPALQWARRAVHHRHALRLASAASAQDVVIEAVGAGLSLDELRAYPQRVEAVDSEAVRALLEPCLGREVATLVGPRIELGPGSEWPDWRAQASDLDNIHGSLRGSDRLTRSTGSGPRK
jgi:hypothetical protein